TSNLGSDLIQSMAGTVHEEIKTAVMEVVSQAFRPDFINRVDDAVVFHPLEKEQIADIAKIQLATLIDRVKASGICLTFDDKALTHLVDVGFDPVYGARPLKRAVQRHVENPLAEALLSGEFVQGDHVRVEERGGEMAFAKVDISS
ncbi:MAG: type VI secretion system ATPase TssH, partial [Gammaproteobacteria bacterium]